MPTVEHTAYVNAPIESVWAFVREFDNWAPFVIGYERHARENETNSVWTLTGDLGGLTRTVDLAVHITNWRDLECVEFELRGVNEPVEGSGAFRVTGELEASVRNDSGALRKLWDRALRWLLELVLNTSKVERAEDGNAAQCGISFSLELNAGGASGAMLNALMAPMLRPAAEDLANNIAARVEQLSGDAPID